MRVTKAELRLRLKLAADRITQMIDSGWTPHESQSIRSVYVGMFAQYNTANRNSFDDLYDIINYALDKVGIANRAENQRLYSLEFGQYQVDVSTEFTHDLEFYMATKQPNSSNVTNLTVQGDVNFLQTGGKSKVTQNIGFNPPEIVEALAKFKEAVGPSNEPHKAALIDIVDRGISDAKNPNATWQTIAVGLNGVQNIIRTTGAVPSAWNLVSGLFATHGVHLPALPAP